MKLSYLSSTVSGISVLFLSVSVPASFHVNISVCTHVCKFRLVCKSVRIKFLSSLDFHYLKRVFDYFL